MARVSPTAEGFRAAWRRPSLVFAEVTWRWAVGGTALALFGFGFFEYLRTLPVSNGELLLLRSRHPVLMARALSHILHGSLDRVVISTVLGILALAGLWVVVGAVGRAATLRGLFEYVGKEVASKFSTQDASSSLDDALSERPVWWRGLLGLNFLRAASILAACVALVGATIVAGFVSTPAHPRGGLAFLIFLLLASLVSLAAWALNWILSLAALYAVRDGADTFSALSASVTLWRERLGPVSAVTSWFGLIHLGIMVGASMVLSVPLTFLALLPGRVILLVLMFLSLVYFAVVDWLYMARLAGYACIVELPAEAFAPVKLAAVQIAPTVPPPASEPPSAPPSPVETTIDRDERILSDPGPFANFATSW